jgi:fucose permease
MFVFGMVMALLGAVLPALSERLEFDLSRAGTLFLSMNCAMLVCQLAIGPLMDRFGKKPPMVAGPLLVALSLWMIAGASSFGVLAAALAILGFGGGAVNGAANTLVADLHDDPRRKNAALNLLGVFSGVGAVLLPFTIGSLIESLGLASILSAAAALCLVPAVFAALLPFPPPLHRGRMPLAEAGRLARTPLVLAFACLLFFELGNEFILGGYVATFLTGEIGVSIKEASFLLAIYWATLIIARMLLGRILIHVKGGTVIRFSALCAVLGVGLLALAYSDISAVPALVLTGVGAASIFPTTLGLAGTRFAGHSGTVFGMLFGAALSGGMSLPWALGQLGSAYGFREALMLPILGFVMIFFIQTFIGRALRAPRTGLKVRPALDTL